MEGVTWSGRVLPDALEETCRGRGNNGADAAVLQPETEEWYE